MVKRIVDGNEVHLYSCVAVCLGAWGAGDSPEDAKKQMIKSGGKSGAEMYIAYKATSDKLTCEGGCLTAYPPEGGSFKGTGFDDIEETRYQKGQGFSTGRYGQVQWPSQVARKSA